MLLTIQAQPGVEVPTRMSSGLRLLAYNKININGQ